MEEQHGRNFLKSNPLSAEHPNTFSDLAPYKIVIMDGKRLGGIRAITIEYDCDKNMTEVCIKMAIKKESMKIAGSKISFESFTWYGEDNGHKENAV